MPETYTRDEIIMKMNSAQPTIEQWRQRFDERYRDTLLLTMLWRLQCYELTQRAQLQLTFEPWRLLYRELTQRAQLQLTYTKHPMLNCPLCHQRHPITGGGLRFVLGERRRVCKLCAARIDKAKRKGFPR